MREGHQLQGPNKFLLPAEVASRIAKLSILPWAPVYCLLCSHWYVNSAFHTSCLAERTFTGHVLKAAGSWPGVVQLLSTSQSSFTSFAVPRNEGAFRVEGVGGRMAEEQVNWQVSSRRRSQRMHCCPHRHRGGRAGRLQVCGHRDWCEDTHNVIYTSPIYNMPSIRHACLVSGTG